MFGYTIIRKDRLKELERQSRIAFGIEHYVHWFSGWTPVYELLLKFKLGKVYNTSVWGVRSEFAKQMNTDHYGNPKNET